MYKVNKAGVFGGGFGFKTADDDQVVFVRDLGKLGIDLGTDKLEVDMHQRAPGLLNVLEGHIQNHVDDAHLHRGEHAPGQQGSHRALAKTAEKTVQRTENNGRINHHQRVTTQRVHADHVH